MCNCVCVLLLFVKMIFNLCLVAQDMRHFLVKLTRTRKDSDSLCLSLSLSSHIPTLLDKNPVTFKKTNKGLQCCPCGFNSSLLT